MKEKLEIEEVYTNEDDKVMVVFKLIGKRGEKFFEMPAYEIQKAIASEISK